LIADFKVGLTYVTWLLFFLTPIYYNYDLIDDPTVKQYMLLNPAVVFIQSTRESLLFGTSPDYALLFIYLIVGLLLILIGQYLVNKYDTKYVMMK
jgi:ABC-type polysaccharide/polyol phosphate export permease